MILYNVTVKIDRSVHDDWLDWMRSVHIPEVMSTGFFIKNQLMRLLDPPADEEGITYAIQYYCKNVGALKRYWDEEAPALQAKHSHRYEGKYVSFRTVMKLVE
jgi:hypothetical protein